jgi:hypothetical protein
MEDICGVNMPAGYYNAHTSEEYLVISEWLNTLDKAEALLSKPLKRYLLDNSRKRPYFRPQGLYGIPLVFPPKKQSAKTEEVTEIALEFIESEEMRDFLRECLPDWYAPKVIVHSLKPLEEKMEALRRMSELFKEKPLESIQGWVFDFEGTLEYGRADLPEKNAEGKRLYRLDFDDASCNQHLPVPFEPGDIVQIDNSPVDKPFRAVVIEKYEDGRAFCACVIEDGSICIDEIKQLPEQDNSWRNYYRLAKYSGDLEERELVLKTIRQKLLDDPAIGEVLMKMVCEADEEGNYEHIFTAEEVLSRINETAAKEDA